MKLNKIVPWKKDEHSLARRRGNGDPFTLLQRQMDSLFEDFFGNQLPAIWERGQMFVPQIDISETDAEVRIVAELPGLDEKDVEVTLGGDILTLKGEKKEEHTEESEDRYHSERSYGCFERAVRLPDGVDVDHANANFKNGVLKIAIPKKAESRAPRRKLELKSGE